MQRENNVILALYMLVFYKETACTLKTNVLF